MPGGKPAWKKDTGVGKRLKQAAEGASSDTQIAPRPSVQDRLRRYRYLTSRHIASAFTPLQCYL